MYTSEGRKEERRRKIKAYTAIGGVALIALSLLGLVVWWLFFTASGQDFRTDTRSNISGIEREIVVYTQFGDEIERYSGDNIRMDYSSDGRVQIQLDSGKRIQVSNALVIVEEPDGGDGDE